MLKRLTMILLTIAMLFSVVTPSLANGGNNYDESLKMIKEQIEQFEEVDEPIQIDQFKLLSIKLIDNKKAKVQSKILNFDRGRLVNLKEAEIKAFIIPASSPGSTYHEMSNFTIYFDSKNELISTSEFLVSESDEGMFKFQYYINGKNELTMVTEDKFFTEKEYQQNLFKLRVNWDGFLKCMGIVGSLVGPISAACGTACAIPGIGTVVCLTCIGVIIGLPTGSLTGCLISNW